LLEGINTPGVEAIKHEQEDDNDQPQIGKATLFLSGKLLRVNFCEAVDEVTVSTLAMRMGAIV
jgi:hypothetical protein